MGNNKKLLLVVVMVVMVVGLVGGMNLEKVRKERESIQYGYSPIEGEAVFLEFDEDLYMSDDLYCLPLLEESPKATCLPCVYDSPDSCPSHIDPLSPQFSEETQQYLQTLPPCSCYSSVCDTKEFKKDVTIKVSMPEKSSLLYRYEHDSFDQGFIIKTKAISNYSPTITISTTPTFALTEIIATSDYDNILVCPSHPFFGEKSNTVTYFIALQSEKATSIHLTIEDLPFSDIKDEPVPFAPPNASINWEIVDQDLEKGAYTSIEGDYFVRNFGARFSPISVFVLLYPLSECGTFSLRSELNRNGKDLWVPNIFLGVLGESELSRLDVLDVAVVLQLETSTHHVSQDSVLGFCPKDDDEQNYIFIYILTSPYPWRTNFFLQKSSASPFIESHSLSDPYWSYIQVQERLKDIWTMNLPCSESEFCLQTPPPLSVVTRKNLIDKKFFPSLLYPTDDVQREDMLPQIGFQAKGSYFLRCQNRDRDSGCGLFLTLKGGSYASPIVYPAVEPLYSINSLPTLEAEDLSYLFPFKANSLTLFFTASIQFQTILSSERLAGSSIIFSNPNCLHTKDFGHSNLPTLNYGDIKLKEETSCNFDTFNPLFELYTYFHNVLEDSQNGNSVDNSKNYLGINAQTANFWSYTLGWTSEFQSCWRNTLALQSFRNEEELLRNSTVCTNPNDLQDPCCNPNLGWSDCCSPEDREVVQIQSLPYKINDDFNDQNCFDPDCMETLSKDFREIYRNSLEGGVCLVNDEIFSNISQFFQFCTSNYIGDQPDFGVHCDSNSDCDFLGDSNGYCDLNAKKCIVDTEDQENAFLQCLIDQMGGFSATLVYQQLVNDGIANPGDYEGGDFLTVELLRQYAVDGENRCFDDYGAASNKHQYYTLQSQPTQRESICPVCDETTGLPIRCLSEFSCVIPTQCYDTSEACKNNFVRKSPSCEEATNDDFVCNWDNSIIEPAICEEEEFRCMYCFNSTYCVDLPATSREECETTPVCVLFDSELLWDVSEEECERRMTCSEGGATTEEECVASGTCNDPDEISASITAMLKDFPLLAPALTNGVCITPLNPYNTPACPLLRPDAIVSLDFSSQRGCVRLGQCFFNFAFGEFSCIQDPSTEEDCINRYQGTWLPLPISTEEACENPRYVSEEEKPGFCRLNYKDTYLTPQNRSECEECGGEALPPALWEARKWKSGTSVKATWRKAEMKPLYSVSTSTISYFKLQDLFEQVALNYETFILWTGESCLIYPFVNYINIVTCDCPAGGEPSGRLDNPYHGFLLKNEDCLIDTDAGIIGTVWFCPNSDFTVGVISGVITSKSEYVTGELCFFSEITLASISSFVGNREREPVTVTNDPNELDPEPVRNQKGASVGFVLGDGVAFQLSENVQPVDWENEVEGVQLTFTIDRTVFGDNNIPDWYVIDFGIEVVDEDLKTRLSDEIELQPVNAYIGLTIGMTVGEVLEMRGSIDIDGVLPEPFRYKKAARIYPIARLPEWENEDSDVALSDGEQAMTGIFAGLYGIAFFVTIFLLLKGMQSLTLSLLVLFIYVLATFSFRAAFWAIVASGDYEETSAGYYILIEPPSFFILSVLTVLIMSFAFIVTATKNGDGKLAQYWVIWALLQLFLIAVLFVVVGLMIGLDTSDVVTTSCFGRESSVEENTTIRDIRIAYHSFILAIAIICAFYVVKLGRDLPDDDNKSTLQILSALAGLAVVLTSLLWVIYSAIDESTPYFVIPLFITEAPPLLLMCYLAFPKPKQYASPELDL